MNRRNNKLMQEAMRSAPLDAKETSTIFTEEYEQAHRKSEKKILKCVEANAAAYYSSADVFFR